MSREPQTTSHEPRITIHEPQGAESVMGWKPVVKVCILALIVLGAMALVRLTPLKNSFEDLDSLREQALVWREMARNQIGSWLPLGYVAVGTFLVGIGFPRLWYSFIGGVFFGFVGGTVWAHVASMTSSMACFWFAQFLGRDWIERKFGHRFHRIERRMKDEGFPIMLMVRLCPIGNNFITNCLAGVSAMKAPPFFFASLIGHLPQTLIFALLGSGLAKGKGHQTLVSLGLLIASSLVFAIYYRRSRAAAEVARELRGEGNVE